ncbi:MAG: hypothetical protein ACREMI_06130 [Gemmatimonadales bacterium]
MTRALFLLLVVACPAAAQSGWSVGGRMGIIEHRVAAGFGNEHFSGWVIGLEVERQFGTRVHVQLLGQGAELRPAAAGDLDRRIGEIAARARIDVRSWWGLYSAVTLRVVASDAARQRWRVVRIGAELRPAFSGGSMRAIGRFGVIPVAAISGLSTASFAFDGAVGLEYERPGFTLGMLYGLERFAFPSENGVRRSEQMSTLTLQGGIRLARRRV